MGNTTRRQPISFSIPAAPDYKFLNITDFAGLNITDNPFTAKANTASDALNVYVDENNALTTRPRLEKIEELLLRINQPSMILIDVVNTKFGILVHGLVGDEPLMYLVSDDNILPLRTSGGGSIPIPRTKSLVIEQGDYVYLLGDSNLIRFDNLGFLSQIASTNNPYPLAYIPTRRSIDATSEQNYIGADIEPLNVVTNVYKDVYFWDGITKLDYLDSMFITSYENKYVNSIVTDIDTDYARSLKKHIPNYLTRIPDAEAFYSTYLSNNNIATLSRTELSLSDATNFTMTNPLSSDLPYFSNTLHVDSTDDGSIIALCYSKPSWITKSTGQIAGGVFVFRDGAYTKLLVDDADVFESKYKTDYDYRSETLNNTYRIRISKDGNIILTYSNTEVIKFKYNTNTSSYDIIRLTIDSANYECIGVDLSSDGSIGIAKLKSKTSTDYNTFSKLMIIRNDVIEDFSEGYSLYSNACLGKEGDYLCISNYPLTETRLYTTFKTNKEYIKTSTAFTPMIVSEDNDKIYTAIGYYVISNDWYYSGGYTGARNNDGFIPYATSSKLYTTYRSSDNYEYSLKTTRNTFDYNQSEPLFHISKYLIDTDPDYSKWEERRDLLLNAQLTTTFDNNRWFCNGNKLFYTSFNDITYVPINNYTVIGDDSPITGFNLANDNLLIAYKKDKLYQITPTTINNIYTYSFEDTKNTVGNEAFGSTIVTTLTERPLQITRDGIFALNQLKNVQSSDRISVLISEKINKKWLAEKDELIYNCKTLNRLYWTYFILSDDTLKITKIYLLDNRTSSWYYWELPIIVTSAFIDDNVTKFVDIDGNLYKLETKDAFNKYNPEITEYYDDGQKLIKWYWQSQILPLGTINYSKRLVNTTFIVSDTEMSDEYGLNYSFKIYRKLVSESNTTTVSDNLNYVQSVTKKTMIPRFNFIQIKLSNIEEEDNEAFNNNKFRLIGLGLKYVLLEGLY